MWKRETERASSDAVAYINSSSGDKSVVQKQETFDGDDQMDQMGTSGENVSGSVAAFVTTGGQNINIIHGDYAIRLYAIETWARYVISKL